MTLFEGYLYKKGTPRVTLPALDMNSSSLYHANQVIVNLLYQYTSVSCQPGRQYGSRDLLVPCSTHCKRTADRNTS